MALETLKNLKQINGYEITRSASNFSKHRPIMVDDDKGYNHLAFQLQDGPVKENGVNGCQVVDILETCRIIIDGLNKKFPCRENDMTVTKTDEAIMWQLKRTIDRELRNVSGTSNV